MTGEARTSIGRILWRSIVTLVYPGYANVTGRVIGIYLPFGPVGNLD